MRQENIPEQWTVWLKQMDDWITEYHPGTTDRSHRNYRSTAIAILRLLDAYGLPQDPKKLGPKEFNDFYNILMERKYAVSTGRNYEYVFQLYVKSSGNEGLKDRKLAWQPDKRPNVDWLTPEETVRLLEAPLNPEQRMLVHLELCMGLRRIDSIRLRKEFIDWTHEKLHVLGKGHGNGKERDVDFAESSERPSMDTRTVFQEYLDYRTAMVKTTQARNGSTADPEKLLIYSTGNELGSFSEDGVAIDNRMKEISRLVGIEFSNHTLRRTFGRSLYECGCKIEDIAAIMGHDDPKMTFKYLGLDRVDHKKDMKKLDFWRLQNN